MLRYHVFFPHINILSVCVAEIHNSYILIHVIPHVKCMHFRGWNTFSLSICIFPIVHSH